MFNFINNSLTKSVVVFLMTWLVIKAVGGFTAFSDDHFPAVNQFFSNVQYFVSSQFPFSIGDIFYTVLFIGIIAVLFYLIRSVLRKDYMKFRKYLAYFIYSLTLFYLLFNLLWGMFNYRKPLKDTLIIEEPMTLDELKSLSEFYFLRAAIYRSLITEDENGVFKYTLTENQLNDEMIKSSVLILKNHPEIKIIESNQVMIKKSLFSTMFSYLGVLGYYNPFSGESQYNAKMPDSRQLFTKLHEASHRLGFSNEGEANFVGFMMGIYSDNPELQYIANFQAMRNVLNRILWYEPEFVKDFVENRYTPGMKRDRDYEITIAKKYDSKADYAFSLMNEAFLKLNNQEGLESYNRFTDLLVGFNRKYF